MDDRGMKRVFGTFYGQIIGDALGVRYEGYPKEIAQLQMAHEKKERRNSNILLGKTPVLPILGSDPPFIKAGQFTDDSEMAVSLARSIIAKEGFDPIDTACAYAYWLNETRPKTSGLTTQYALSLTDCKLTQNWRDELTNEEKRAVYEKIQRNVQELNQTSLSNGSLMRISPVAIAYKDYPIHKLRNLAKEDAKLTHANPIVWDAAATYVVGITNLLNGASKENAYKTAFHSAETEIIRTHLMDAQTHALPVKLPQDIVWKNLKEPPPQITNGNDDRFSGYLGIALQNAFYELLHAEDFSTGLENTIARGGDTDTNGCITAALLGARFGMDNIPEEWIDTVKCAEPCRLSWSDVRNDIDMEFLSIKDVDELVPKLVNSVK